MANPEGGEIVGGSATISQNGKKLDVNQHTDKAIIDWRSFDIDVDEHTQFYQPSSGATALNRVKSNNPSQILGKLSANGNIILINPNGVFFGADSRVDVNGLIATSADIDNQRFLNDTRLSFDRPGSSDAQIINNGEISAREAGLVGLVAPQVINNGIIRARLGTVHLAAGDTAIIDLYGDGLTGVAVSGVAGKKLIENTGVIEAQGGEIHLSAATAGRMVDNLIAVKGELRAPSVSQKNGKIIISGQKSGVDIGANIDVSGKNSSETGGEIQITGDQIVVRKNAIIDASGDSGGGQVYIGGDYQGQGELYTAAQTFTEKGAFINASALEQGDGGRVIVWADGRTDFYGDILARGGNSGGDGGFVEVSGKDYLNYKGFVDTQAPLGEVGTLLLDPANIVIVNGSGDSAADGNGTFSGAPSAVVGSVAGGDTGPSSIFESELEGIAATTNISLAATNSITINNLSDNTLNLAQTAGRSVTFSTGAGGFIMSDVNDTIVTAGGALNITTTGGTSTIGNLATGAGLKTFNIGGTATVSGVINGTGGITKTGTGTLRLNGNNTYSGTTTITAGSLLLGSNTALGTGNVALNGGTLSAQGGSRTLSNNVTIGGNAAIGGSSDLTFNGIFGNLAADRTLTLTNTALTTITGNIPISNSGTSRRLTIAGAGNLTVNGNITNGSTSTVSAITKTNTGTLTLNGNNSFGGTTILTAGTTAAGSNTALGTGAISLNGGTLQGAGGSRTLNNNITLAANSTIAGTSDLSLNGTITNSGGNRTLTVSNTGQTSFGGTVNLSENTTNRILTIAGSGNTTFSGVIQNGGGSTAGVLTKSGTGTMIVSGNNTYAGATNITGGTLRLGAANRIANGSILSVNSGATFDLNSFSETISSITSAGSVVFGTGATLTTSGAQNYTGTVSGTNVSLVSTGGGAITATNAANDFIDALALSTTGAANVVDANNLTLGTTGVSTIAARAPNGILTLDGQVTASATSGTSITLQGGTDFVNNFGATALQTSGTARWMVFEDNPTPDTKNGLGGQNRYGCAYNAGAPDCAAGTDIPASGNVFYFATAPTLTISGLSADDKIYDATTVASLSGTGTLNGILFGDGVGLDTSSATASFDTKNVGTGKTVTASGYALSGTNLGYLLSQPSSLSADITPADLTLFGLTASNKVYDTTTAATLGSTASVSALGSDSVSLSGTAIGTFNNKNVGTAKTVTVSGLTLTGTDAGNYTLLSQPGLIADITPADLTAFGLTALDKVYDATLAAPLSGTAQINPLGADDVVLSGTAAGLFSDKNVGSSKAVTVSGLSLSGTDAGNYTFIPQTGLTANITTADILATGLSASDRIYDGTTSVILSGTAIVTPLGSDSLFLAGTPTGVFADKNTGNNKSVVISGLSLTGTDASNYNLLPQGGVTANVTPRPLTVSSITADDKNFDGTTTATISSFIFDDLLAGDSATISGLAGTFDSPAPGTNKTVTISAGTLSGTDASNYLFSLGTANDFATIFAPPSSPSESLANNLPNTFVFSSQTPLNFEIVSSFDQSGSSDIPNYKTTNFIPSSLESLIVIDPKLKEQISLEDGL